MKIDDAEARELAKQLAVKMFEEAETKRVFKEALNEWLEKKYAEFAHDSMKVIMVSLFGAAVTFVLWTQGYHK